MAINLSMGSGAALYALDHVDPVLTIVAFCKMRLYILQSTSMMYRWCLVMASFDRYALSSINARLRNFAKVHTARRVVLVIVALWFVLPVHILIFYNLRNGNCGILYSYAAALYHSLFTTIAGSVLPVLLMATAALLIYRNLVLKQKRREQNMNQRLEVGNETGNLDRKRDQQVLLMLLAQVIVYVVLITPLMGFYFYSAVSLNIPNKTADRLAIERFVQFVGETTVYVFPSSSFYLYTMASSTFRKELARVVRFAMPCTRLNNNNRIEPITTDTTRRRTADNQAIITRMSRPLVSDRDILRRPTEIG
jgi:flagellar biosynthesis protein FlhB